MKTILSLSGGIDSTTLLGYYKSHDCEIVAVNFFYGSKHGIREGIAAEKIAEHYKVELIKLNLETIFDFQSITSTLMTKGGSIPEGHYNDSSMKRTVVPGRNTIFAAILAGIAESLNYQRISMAIHQGDHYIYPDCRPDWFGAMALTISRSTENRVTLTAPFLWDTKADIIARGIQLKVPYSLTYTCYKGEAKPCGVCGSCRERLEAFERNGCDDPGNY